MLLLVIAILALLRSAQGALSVTPIEPVSIAKGRSITLTCTQSGPLTEAISWKSTRYAGSLTSCLHTVDNQCFPSEYLSKYTFKSDVSLKEFYMVIKAAEVQDTQTYTCGDSQSSSQRNVTVTQGTDADKGGFNKIGLGVGLGLGIPLLVVIVFVLWKRRHRFW